MNLSYAYDYTGNIINLTDPLTYPDGKSRSRIYKYDDLDRLIEADSESYGGNVVYQYDKIGNMTYNCKYGHYTYDPDHPHAVKEIKKTDGTLAAQYVYDDNGNMVNSYSYDRNGVPEPDEDRVLTYNYDNMPTSILRNGSTTDSDYDANGQRVKKASQTGTTIYVGNLYECTGGVCTNYIMSGTQIIAQINTSGTYYFHTDHLGSSSIITDSSGSQVEDIYYYPYGEIKTNVGSTNVRYKFTGKEYDSEDGLYYYGARYYDPKLARFISADTIVPLPFYPISLNRYAYAYNNPIRVIDLDGHYGEYYDYSSDNWWSSMESDGSYDYSYSYQNNYSDRSFVTQTYSYPVFSTPALTSYSSNSQSYGWGGRSSSSDISFNMYAANTNGTSTGTGLGGYGGSGNLNGSSLLFNGENIYWYNDQGQSIKEYPSVSGPYGKGRLPQGSYIGDNLRIRNDKAMTCPDGGWSLDLTPNFETDRTLLRIHPDGNITGTLGCIGVNCTASGLLYNNLKYYFNLGNSSIPVIVNYNLKVNLGDNK